jgi:hypothetical protein
MFCKNILAPFKVLLLLVGQSTHVHMHYLIFFQFPFHLYLFSLNPYPFFL